jgi:Zn finger protein HypA/HybF involved in hydrogenase expression
MASASKTAKGFAVICPFCMVDDASVSIGLSDLECYCGNCDESFTPEQARDKAAKTLAEWDKITRWVAIGRELAAE